MMVYYFTLPFIFFISFLNQKVEFFFFIVLVSMFYCLRGMGVFFFESLSMISYVMIMLTLLIFVLMFLYMICKFYLGASFEKNFIFYSLSLMVILILLFQVSSFLLFYILFEFSVFPIFMMICNWGFNFERMSAGLYMLLYTFLFSLPFLYVTMVYIEKGNTLSFYISNFSYKSIFEYYEMFLSLLIFLVKMPSYFFHVWLPNAHVEAPVWGSMILAGVLLKLGVYGLLVWVSFIFYQYMETKFFFFSLGCWGMLMSSICCLMQVDLKKMIAYMSIIHMSMILSSFSPLINLSFWGLLFMAVSHGLTSSGMFYLLNCLYERCHSRSILVLSGVGFIIPFFSFWCILMVISNVGIPPTFSFFSEIILMWSIFMFSNFISLFVLISMFLGALCSLVFYVSLSHGVVNYSSFYENMNLSEHLISFSHLYFIFSIIMFM